MLIARWITKINYNNLLFIKEVTISPLESEEGGGGRSVTWAWCVNWDVTVQNRYYMDDHPVMLCINTFWSRTYRLVLHLIINRNSASFHSMSKNVLRRNHMRHETFNFHAMYYFKLYNLHSNVIRRLSTISRNSNNRASSPIICQWRDIL